jgi:hypothetical protein
MLKRALAQFSFKNGLIGLPLSVRTLEVFVPSGLLLAR